jgi:hypothetical protein
VLIINDLQPCHKELFGKLILSGSDFKTLPQKRALLLTAKLADGCYLL